jgi:hypothetical protein
MDEKLRGYNLRRFMIILIKIREPIFFIAISL